MHRSINSRNFIPVAFALAFCTNAANADYQQTLAAQGADAFTAPEVETNIDKDAVANTFTSDMVEVNPAMTDQEVMMDLQARIRAEQRLEAAAAALDPTPQTETEAAVASR